LISIILKVQARPGRIPRVGFFDVDFLLIKKTNVCCYAFAGMASR
jgi:hypothetical protein